MSVRRRRNQTLACPARLFAHSQSSAGCQVINREPCNLPGFLQGLFFLGFSIWTLYLCVILQLQYNKKLFNSLGF
jgi:hypothetical protein